MGRSFLAVAISKALAFVYPILRPKCMSIAVANCYDKWITSVSMQLQIAKLAKERQCYI